MDFEVNPDSNKLPLPKLGDLIELRFTDTYAYKVRVKITTISGDNLNGTVDNIFTEHNSKYTEIKKSPVLENIGKSVVFTSEHIFKIFK